MTETNAPDAMPPKRSRLRRLFGWMRRHPVWTFALLVTVVPVLAIEIGFRVLMHQRVQELAEHVGVSVAELNHSVKVDNSFFGCSSRAIEYSSYMTVFYTLAILSADANNGCRYQGDHMVVYFDDPARSYRSAAYWSYRLHDFYKRNSINICHTDACFRRYLGFAPSGIPSFVDRLSPSLLEDPSKVAGEFQVGLSGVKERDGIRSWYSFMFNDKTLPISALIFEIDKNDKSIIVFPADISYCIDIRFVLNFISMRGIGYHEVGSFIQGDFNISVRLNGGIVRFAFRQNACLSSIKYSLEE